MPSPAAAALTLGLKEDGREGEATKSSGRSSNGVLSPWPGLEKAAAASWAGPSPMELFLRVLCQCGRSPGRK